MGAGKVLVGVVAGLAGLALAGSGSAAEDPPPRLKYRAKGPVCSCVSGLGEAEIAGARAGLDRLQAAEPGDRAGMAKGSEQQQRREADEVRK